MQTKIVVGLVVVIAFSALLTESAFKSARLSEARSELVEANLNNAQLQASLETAATEANENARRLDNLSSSVLRLTQAQFDVRQDLNRRLDAIQSVTQQPGDSDESISCLDVLVPRQLDDSLR